MLVLVGSRVASLSEWGQALPDLLFLTVIALEQPEQTCCPELALISAQRYSRALSSRPDV